VVADRSKRFIPFHITKEVAGGTSAKIEKAREVAGGYHDSKTA
jgi:hypothetical protein